MDNLATYKETKVVASFDSLTEGLTTLFAGKMLLKDSQTKFMYKVNGTATKTFDKNSVLMTVAQAGDYVIMEGKYVAPYFEGKRQLFELTCEFLQPQVGVIKQYGYFNCSYTDPDPFATPDGIYLETNDTQLIYYIKRRGTTVFSQDITSIRTDWSKFSVFADSFLWLGGLISDFFIGTPEGVKHQNAYSHVGNENVFIENPQKPIRISIKSTGGAGQFKYICSQIATKGTIEEAGESATIINETLINANSAGTYYLLHAFRKQQIYKEAVIEIDDLTVTTAGGSDGGIVLLVQNPTIAGLTFADQTDSFLQELTVGFGTTVTKPNLGRKVKSWAFNANGNSEMKMTRNVHKYLANNWTVNDTYALIYLSQSTNQNVSCAVNFKQFAN